MTIHKMITTGLSVALFAASTTFAMAQATGKENNATTGSEAGSGPRSGMEDKGAPGASGGDMKGGDMKGSSGSMEPKGDMPTSAGTKNSQAKDLRGHSETPTTGK